MTKQLDYKGPWCCENGQAQGVPVCDECAEISAGYQSCMGRTRTKLEELKHTIEQLPAAFIPVKVMLRNLVDAGEIRQARNYVSGAYDAAYCLTDDETALATLHDIKRKLS